MDLQHAEFGELGQNLLPFLGRQFAAAAIELDRIGTVRALQWTAVRQLGEHGERNTKGLRGRAAGFQHRESVAGRAAFGFATFGFVLAENFTHDVFSRASVRNPFSARSCSMATTSVAIPSRGAAYFIAT